MKIRKCFVSNSSSSSFVIYDFSQEKTKNLIDDIVKKLGTKNKYDYQIDNDSIKKCIFSKINETGKTQNDLLNIYVRIKLNHIFGNMFGYWENQRNWELSECNSCKFYKKHFLKDKKKCKQCRNFYYWFNAKGDKKTFKFHMKDMNEFDFKNEYNEIKKMVYDAPIKIEEDGTKSVDYNYMMKHYDDILNRYEDFYFDMWIKKHPNAHVLSFSSDDGDDNEAFIRYNIWSLINYMKKNEIFGFKGENS